MRHNLEGQGATPPPLTAVAPSPPLSGGAQGLLKGVREAGRLFYLSIPPSSYAAVVDGLHQNCRLPEGEVCLGAGGRHPLACYRSIAGKTLISIEPSCALAGCLCHSDCCVHASRTVCMCGQVSMCMFRRVSASVCICACMCGDRGCACMCGDRGCAQLCANICAYLQTHIAEALHIDTPIQTDTHAHRHKDTQNLCAAWYSIC